MSLPQGENIEEALNREVAEEMGEGNPPVTPEDWLESCFCPGEKILLHFYCKELSEAEFCKFEKRGLQAPEYGVEVLGLVRCGSTVQCTFYTDRVLSDSVHFISLSYRVPLYTRPRNRGGLPMFLKNNFAGNARENLLLALVDKKVLTSEEVNTCLDS